MVVERIIKRLLKIRRILKRRKPDFIRKDSWKFKRLNESWRKPKGKKSRVRRKEKGMIKMPDTGYRSPRKVRGLHPSGYKEVLVYNLKDLDKVDPSKEAIRIAHTVGKRKRILIQKKAEEKGIKVLNPIKIEEK